MFTIATTRYYIKNENGDMFDTFKRKENAILKAVEMATEYPGNKFIVSKMVNRKTKNIFSITIDSEYDIMDAPCFFENVIKVFQNKLRKTSFWRKNK